MSEHPIHSAISLGRVDLGCTPRWNTRIFVPFRLMHETMAVGRAAGVFPPGFPTEMERSVAGFPPTMKALMANDLHAGNRLELDWLAGEVVASDANTVCQRPARKRSTRS
jgi:hypothetical protein